MAGPPYFSKTAIALQIRSAPTSLGFSYWIRMPVRMPGPTMRGETPKYRRHSRSKTSVSGGTTQEIATDSTCANCSSMWRNSSRRIIAYSSSVFSRSVAIRQWKSSSGPRYPPILIWVLLMLTASNTTLAALPGEPHRAVHGDGDEHGQDHLRQPVRGADDECHPRRDEAEEDHEREHAHRVGQRSGHRGGGGGGVVLGQQPPGEGGRGCAAEEGQDVVWGGDGGHGVIGGDEPRRLHLLGGKRRLEAGCPGAEDRVHGGAEGKRGHAARVA